MDQIILFALLGLGTGALIAGIGLGVVLTYRGSGVINVATGAMAMAAGYAFYSLKTVTTRRSRCSARSPSRSRWAPRSSCSCFRPLRTSSPLARLVSSLGVLLTLQAGATLIYGTGSLPAPSVLPRGTVEVTGVAIPADRFWLTGIVIVITILLTVAYRYTRFGLATRAGSENEVSAILAGLPAGELSLANTVLSAVIAGGMGVLAASLAQLDATTLPLQVVPALGAVLFARFTSFAITCVVGLSIGVLQSLLYYASTQSWFPTDKGAALPGISALLTFIIIVIALYVRGSSLPTRGELIEQRLPAVPRPERLASSAVLCAVVGAVALIVLPYDYRNALIISLAAMTICLSYVVITGFIGQVSLMQVALAGTSGFVVSHLFKDAGIGFPLAAIAGTAAATVLGFVAGASALRVRGVSLAVVTLAAAVAIEQFGFANSTWGAGATGSPVPELKLARHRPRDAGLVPRPRRRPAEPDPRLRRARDRHRARPARGPRAPQRPGPADARGALQRARRRGGGHQRAQHEVRRLRDLLGHRRRRRHPLRLLAGLGQRGALRDPHRAGLRRLRLRRRHHDGLRRGHRRAHRDLRRHPAHLRGRARDLGDLDAARRGRHADPQPRPVPRRDRRVALPEEAARAGPCAGGRGAGRTSVPGGRDMTTVLSARGVSVSFGGVRALVDVDLDVPEGKLVGLIGPNGAGKTTFIDAITGFVRSRGTVELAGRDLSRLPPHERARSGLARTWQAGELFDDLTVGEHVTVVGQRETDETLAIVGLESAVDKLPSQLSQGERKLVGVARAMAAAPSVICLDEPAAGLDTTESERLGRQLRQVVDGGTAMLLVDHDMGLVLSVCDLITVLEFGEVIATGTPEEVRRDRRVVEAYLGTAGAERVL